jgi:hypothetical protein
MDEPKLTESLTGIRSSLVRTGDLAPAGSPVREDPGMARRPLRGVLTSAAAVSAVVAVIGVTNLMSSNGTGIVVPTPSPSPVAIRMVGFGHAAIAVPEVWGTNFSRCGIPRKDTVLIDDPSAAFYCRLPRPSLVDSVELRSTPTSDFHADEEFTVDGVEAERQGTACLDDGVCWGAVGIPSQRVWFWATSSTSAEEVDRILARIEIVPGRIGVPSYHSLDAPPTGAAYAKVLEQLGLQAAFRIRTSPGYRPGLILEVFPAPGTMLEPGATVTITITG